MDKVSALLRRAADVRRLIFASLPGNVRFALVWQTLVAGDEAMFEPWGKYLGAAMLNAGIKGMPEPGEAWAKHPGDARRLPHGYLTSFVASVYGKILSDSARDPSVPEEAIETFIAKLHKGIRKLDPAFDFDQAKNYIFKGCVLEGMTIRRRKLREFARQERPQYDDEGGELESDLSDPHALETFKKMEHNPAVWKAYLDYLGHHIDVNAPQFMVLRNEGYDINQIVGGPRAGVNEDGTLRYPGMLDHFTPGKSDPDNWVNKYKRKIVRVTEEFLKDKKITLEDLVPP